MTEEKIFKIAELLSDEAFGKKGLIAYSQRQELTVKFNEILVNNLDIPNVIQRFMNSEIKIKVNDPTKKHLLKHIFIECGFDVEENKYTFEKGRFFWVENGTFNSGLKHLHNSMDLIRRNRNKETVDLSDLNVV